MRPNRCSSIPALSLRREIGLWNEKERRFITDYRIRTLDASRLHTISSTQHKSGISAMAFDGVENRFLLFGSSRGTVSIVDFEDNLCNPTSQQHRVIATSRKSHKYLITNCQWYPVDSGLFITAGMDRTLKLWDSNRLRAIEEFEFTSSITQMHWGICGSSNDASLIAVAIASSNVHLLDPRAGNSIQHLRCKSERINAVWWKRTSNFHLITGSESGCVSLWDIRSGKSELAQLKSAKSYAKKRKMNSSSRNSTAHTDTVICVKDTEDGGKIVSMSLNRTMNCWDSQTLKFENTVEIDYEGTASPVFFDLCNEGSCLWAFVPTDINITIQDLHSKKNCSQKLLQGHFQPISALAYRSNYQQVVTASTDRLVLVWTPEMDERQPENETIASQFHEDAFSDDDL